MSVTYKLSQEDLLYYYRRAVAKAFRLPPGWGVPCGLFLILFGCFVVMGLYNQRVGAVFLYDYLSCFLIFWGSTIAWSCSNPRLKTVIDKQAKANPDLLSRVCVTVNVTHFTASSVYSDFSVRWQGVHQITDNADYIYVSVSQLVHIVPKSSFDSLAEAEAFLNSVKEYWQTAKQMPLETQEGVWPPAPRLEA